jgi:serine-type D-Ala-D-Ala carboxypeptidase/endopeptidase (penicillin-binding protein 4)
MHAPPTSRSSRFLSLLLTIVIALPGPSLAQSEASAVVSRPRTIAELRDRIAALLDEARFSAARWGVLVINDRGDEIFSRDSEKSFTPASNMKLYTSSAALDAFGPDFTIETAVYAPKRVGKSSTLRGDLVLYGKGDPNLSARFENATDPTDFRPSDTVPAIESLADQIKAQGVKRVQGSVVGDDSFFSTDLLGVGWEWDDAQFYYGAEVSALTVNDNVVTFTVTATSSGVPPLITVQPRTEYVKVVNHALTSGQGARRIGVNRGLDSNTVEFFGTIPKGGEKFEVNVAVHDPALFGATLLKEALVRRGILVGGKATRQDAVSRMQSPLDLAKLDKIARVTSPPLSAMLKVINKPSQNLHTELLLRQLGAHGDRPLTEYGRPRATDQLGDEVRRKFLERAGIDLRALSLRDGSGLARQDLVTPRSTSQLLSFMRSHQYFQTFRDSLPIAGQDGTLERRMRDSIAAGNVRAKTGTLSYVSSLSGYLQTRSGQLLIFSMMGNNYVGPGRDVTQVLDQICILLADFEGQL